MDFGPLAPGAVNLANCDATGNSQTWTFDAVAPAMVVTLNGQQLGVPVEDVFVNDSTNLETIGGSFLLFDFGPSTTRRFVRMTMKLGRSTASAVNTSTTANKIVAAIGRSFFMASSPIAITNAL